VISQTSVQKTEPPEYAIEPMKRAIGAAEGLYEGGGMEYFPGQTYAPQTGLEQQGLGMQEQAALGSQGISQGLGSATSFGLSSQALMGNPYLEEGIERAIRPVGQQLTENILPNLRRHAVGTGGFDSTRRGVGEGVAAGRALDTMGDISSRMSSEGYGQGLQHQLQTMGLAPSSLQAMQMPGQALQGIGGQYRGEQQLGIDDQMSRFNFGQQEPYNAIDRLIGTIQGTSSGYGTSSGTSPANPWGTALGVGGLGLGAYNAGLFGGASALGAGGTAALAAAPAMGAGIGASLPFLAMSSRQFKENIEAANNEGLMNLVNSIDITTFDYKDEFGGQKDMIGMIAEDTPDEFTTPEKDAVNLYNLVGALVASNQVLTKRIESLESQNG